jgi:23S rRNA (guanosine2251-2'-O)-methyltransferase
VDGGESLFDVTFSPPVGLVIGSEQKGIRDGTIKNLDLKVTIPMTHPRLSYNVAHATAMLCYEITRQKK